MQPQRRVPSSSLPPPTPAARATAAGFGDAGSFVASGFGAAGGMAASGGLFLAGSPVRATTTTTSTSLSADDLLNDLRYQLDTRSLHQEV